MDIQFTRIIGMLLLAVWLILMGLAAFIPGLLATLLALLAIVAGGFIIVGK